ncbi:MAG: endonuclease MutS2 [Nitrospirota bacterium]
MNEHTLRVLEYRKVISIVSRYAASEPGRVSVSALLPSPLVSLVETRLQETFEGVRILQSGDSPDLHGIQDIQPSLRKLEISGTTLSPLELLQIAQTLETGRRIKKFFSRFEGKGTVSLLSVPLLSAKAASIYVLKNIEEAITSAVDEKGEVRDSASPELRKIRKQIARNREEILERMTDILHTDSLQKIIQEPVITMRDDRYVLPLKPNFRQSLQGIVHGHSGSRSTLFVEPLDILESNNRLAELRMDEYQEVERILRELAALLAQEIPSLTATLDALIAIDAIFARALFGLDFQGAVPTLAAGSLIRLYQAKHPLLLEKQKNSGSMSSTIANDIILNEQERALILSGPNAGGKTVILKTVGLLALMMQAGLPIPAREGSTLPCFKSVFADIGDEQSLEQDLSTFSSHIRQIAEILRLAEHGSLVLLDELGSGTDPGEGVALGAAVLDGLIGRGAVTLVTTHHNALKLFGAQTSGAVNAAMEFDLQTLKPTYRLIAGRPGRSYGLDMATRLGMPEEIIQQALARLGDADTKLDDLLKQIEQDSILLASEREALKQERILTEQKHQEATVLLQTTKEEMRTLKEKARQETRDTVAALRQKLKDLSKKPLLVPAEIRETRSEIELLANKLNPGPKQHADSNPDYPYKSGDKVRVLAVNKTGIVLSVKPTMLEIDFNGKKLKLSRNEVSPIGNNSSAQQTAHGGASWSADLQEISGVPNRLNIIGLHVDEALDEVDRFLDAALLQGFTIVTIIHGLGTGALKKAVTTLLKKHPQIVSIRMGEQAEGGAGVTVAEFKAPK